MPGRERTNGGGSCQPDELCSPCRANVHRGLAEAGSRPAAAWRGGPRHPRRARHDACLPAPFGRRDPRTLELLLLLRRLSVDASIHTPELVGRVEHRAVLERRVKRPDPGQTRDEVQVIRHDLVLRTEELSRPPTTRSHNR